MSATLSMSETQLFTAVRGALLSFGLTAEPPGDVPIIRGQVNRVPEPDGTDFCVLWPIARDRLAQNIDSLIDAAVTGSIIGNVLTATGLLTGNPAPGQTVYGVGVSAECQITRQLSGPSGGLGTYATTPTADVTSETLYIGTKTALQKTEVTIQCDVHGPASGDNAQRISTLWRDQFGVDALSGQNDALAPLYTSEPRQIPFTNGEQQFEERWIVDLCLQADIGVTVTQQFADQLEATPVSVDTLAP